MTLLALDGIEAGYGLLRAVRNVALSLEEGERVALVGANGAGKTTLLRSIAGAHAVSSGSITFDGSDVTHLAAHRRVRLGIALVPEGRRLFPELTVEENLRVAQSSGRAGQWNVETIFDTFSSLAPLRKQRASTLSGGQQQAAAIARALMTNPRLLLLDEVSLGLSPVAVATVYESLARLTATGTSMILVEQDLTRAMAFSDRVVCVLEGQIVLTGTSADLTREQVTAAYFGLRHKVDPR
jgi:branched-chain amino acid transport system ATP-binding protein